MPYSPNTSGSSATTSKAVGTPIPKLAHLVRSITEVSSIPAVVARTMEIVNDPNSSAADLMQVVETDPSLSARLLRMVNSAAFSLVEPVYSIHRAICLLGFNQVKSLALSLSVADIFRSNEKIGPYTRLNLWNHLVSVGVIAKMTALRVGMTNFEEAFVAGLLHDFGIILFDQYAHPHFVHVLLQAAEEQRPLDEVEHDYFGFDHAQLGVALAAKWRFPDSILQAIEFHHRPLLANVKHRQLTCCVELANAICTRKGITSVGISAMRPPSAASLATLKISREGLSVLIENVANDISKYSSLLNPWSA